jgi:hypothetical protein
MKQKTAEVHWELLTRVESDIEATMIVDLLEADGIPALKQSSTAGVFGYGFSAPTPEGIKVSVPSDMLEEARALLDSRPTL